MEEKVHSNKTNHANSTIAFRIPTESSEKPRLSLRPQLTQFAARGCIDQIEALIEDGADVDSRSPNGSSALMIAAKYGQLHAVNILLKHGAQTHREALMAAQAAGHQEIVEFLSNKLNS